MNSARVPVVLFIRLHKLALHSSLTCKLNSHPSPASRNLSGQVVWRHSCCTDLTQLTKHNESENKTEITWQMADSFINLLWSDPLMIVEHVCLHKWRIRTKMHQCWTVNRLQTESLFTVYTSVRHMVLVRRVLYRRAVRGTTILSNGNRHRSKGWTEPKCSLPLDF